VILEVNRETVGSVAEFRSVLSASKGGALLLVSRGGSEIIMALKAPRE
jgi:hypothetical protein